VVAGFFDHAHDLAHHVGVVVVETQGVADRHTAADVEAGEGGAEFAQLAVHFDAFLQLAPVVNGVLDADVHKKVEHFQLEFRVVRNQVLVKGNNLALANAQARGVELEIRFLLGGHPNTDAALFLG